MAMEILTAIIPTIIDYTVRPLGRQVSYVIFYNSNLKGLRSTLKNFDAVKQRMNHAVEEVERKVNEKVEVDVRNWQTEADEISREAEAILDDEGRAKTKCLYVCPNLISYHQLSRKSTKLVRKIEEHENKKEFPTISYNAALEDISAIASDEYMAFESRISMVKDIITELKKPDINRIGVYGLGGVGKTTLAKEVYREAVKEKLFDDVVLVLNVKEKRDNEKIQKEITKKLMMYVDESEDRGTRGNLLRARIKEGKTLVILDDVLERIDFEAVGLVGVPNCKLLLTSREKKVLCSDMRTQKDFQLGFLREKESWSLFEKMAGNVVKDNRILKEATQLAKKCGGLPVLVVAVASALRDSSLDEWKVALRSFKRFDKKELNEKEFLALKWSYEQLEDQELKQLFLLCGILAFGNGKIYVFYLFQCAMGLGLVRSVETVEEARISLNSMVKKLKNSCLLLDGYDDETVRMHELVLDVAVRIASDDQKAFSRKYGDGLKEWPTEDFLKKCTWIFVEGGNIPRLPEAPWECPELKLLTLDVHNIGDSQEIPSKFFEGMKELKVLDLTKFHIPSLPPSLQSLKHLHTLCFGYCELVDITLVGQLTNLKILSLLHSKVKELPKEIGQLTRLQLLELTGCSELILVSPDVISSLTRLEDLRMGIKSFKQWEGEGLVDGRRSNASVSELKNLSHLSALDIHVPDANLLPTNLFSDNLERYTILIGDCWKYPDIYATCYNMLKLKLTRSNQFDRGMKLLVKRCEQLYLDGMEIVSIISFLFHSEAVKQLKHLHVQNNDQVTYLINSISWHYSRNAFPNLESLFFEDLVSLESVCYGQLVGEPFQKLKSLTLRNLPKLIGFSSKGKLTIDTEADEIVLEDEVGGPPRLFSNGEVMMPNLTTLTVHQCDSLRFLFSSSMAKCLRQLKNLKISNCQIMEEIVGNEENTYDMFDKLSRLELQHLPSLARFSSGSYIKFPSLVFLDLDDCTKLETFIFDAKSENITTNKEERDIELFDEKVEFPSLEILWIQDLPKLKTIFHNQLHSDSFGKLRIMDVSRCHNLINIFGPSIMGRLNALESLYIKQCQSLQVVYDSSSTAQLNGFDCPNLNLVEISSCESLKNLFPVSVAKNLKQLSKFKVENCGLMEEIVTMEEGPKRTHEEFRFPKVEIVIFENLPRLRSFYHGLHVSNWPLLNELSFIECGSVEIFSSEFSIYHDKLELRHPTPMKQPFFLIDKVMMPNLTTLTVHQCDSLRFLFSSSMAKCLRQFKNLKISNCQIMEEIVRNEENTDDMFDKLNRLELQHLPNLTRFSSGSYIKFPSLAYLDLDDCTKLETFIFDTKSENITTNKEERDIELFDEKVGFPSLDTLYIWDLPKLKTIFHNQLHSDSFSKLKIMDVRRCHSLINIFGPSIMGRLNALETLQIKQCQSLQVVYDTSSTTQLNCFEFSKVTCMMFEDLPQLRSFYPGLHVSNWPLLNTLNFKKCANVEIFASESSTYQDKLELSHPTPMKQPFFLIEKGKSFINLEYLMLDENTEIWYEPYGPLPAELFSKIKSIYFATSHPKSDVFFENLQNIENLGVLSAPWKELIVHNHRGSSSGEIHEVETFPRVKTLWLIDMPELMHLGMENSQPGVPVFPNLEILCLQKCGRLENLASTLISFRNLTSLAIRYCHGLQYLIPYSVAKNLQQLKEFEVESCERMVEIVVSNRDDPENEITFSCLQHLKLFDLPSLQGFCTGNYIFKVPSLPSNNLIVEKCPLIELTISLDGLLQSDPRPERLQIAEETDDVQKLGDSKENERDQTEQLVIADSNVDVTIARLFAKKESSSFAWRVKVFRLCAIACLCVIFLFLLFFFLKEEISAWRADWKAL